MKRINSYNEKFYPDIEDKTYWSCKIEYSLYEGVLSKDENEKTKYYLVILIFNLLK
jgi:hypothetical protein